MADDVIGRGVVEVVGKTDDVSAKIAKVGDDVDRMAQKAVQAGKTASEGLGQVGQGAGKASASVDAATRSFEANLKRQIASLSGAKKGTEEYVRTQAKLKGADAKTLEPLIRQYASIKRGANEAAQASRRMADGQRYLQELSAKANGIGKTASELAALRAQQLGVAKDAAPMIAKMREAEQSARKAGSAFSGLASYVKAAAAAFGVRELLRYADGWGQLSSRMAIAAGSADAGSKALSQLMVIANRVYKPIEEVSEIFISTKKTLEEMGYSSAQTMKTVEALSYALTVSGADAQKSTSVMDAWTKAILDGKMNMQQFTSVIAGAPRLQQALAASLGTTNAGLLALVKSGKLTVAQMMRIGDQVTTLGDEADQMPVSIDDAFTKLRNSMSAFLGDADRSVGAVGLITSAVELLAENLDTVATAATAILALKVAQWMGLAAASTGGLAAALNGAAVAAKTFFASLGPLGWAIIAIGTLATVWQSVSHRVDAVGEAGTRLQTVWTGAFGDIKKSVVDVALQIAGVSDKAGELERSAALQNWINSAVVGLARVADLAVFVAKSVGAVALAFNAAMADVKAGLAWVGRPDAATKLLAPEQSAKLEKEYEEVLKARESALKNFNNALDDLLSYQGNKYEQWALGVTSAVKVVSDEVKLVDLTLPQVKAPADQGKAVSAYAALVASIRSKIDENRLEIATGEKASEADKLRIKLTQELAAGKLKLTLAQRGQIDSLLDGLKASEAELNMSKLLAVSRQREIDMSVQAVRSAYLEANQNEDLVATFGLSASAIEQLTVARLRDQLAQKDALELNDEQVKALEMLIDAHERNAAALGSRELLDKQKQANEQWLSDIKGVFDQVGQALTDAIFEGGKSGKELVTNLFKTLVLRVLVQPVMTGLQGVVQGAFGLAGPAAGAGEAAGAGTSALSLVNAGKNLYSMFTGGFAAAGQSITNLGVKLGSQFVADFGYGFGGGANATATAGGMAGVVGSYMAGIGAGYGLGNLISGQYAAFGNSNVATIGGTAAGALIGSQIGMVGGPLGAIIGGAVGGIINRAFGKGQKEYGDTSIRGTFGASGFYGYSETPWSQKGGWFSSGDSGMKYGHLDRGMELELSAAFKAMKAGVAGLAGSLGVAAEQLDRHTDQIYLTLTDDAQKNQELIAAALSAVGENLIRTVIPAISDYAKQGETATQTLERLSASLVGVNAALQMVQKELLDISLAGADAASSLAQLFGGVDQFVQASQAFYEVAYTDAERAAISMRNMTEALAAVGVSMPDTMVQLRDLALSMDLTTDAGRAAYAALISIAPEFAAVAEAASRSAQELAAATLDAFTSRSGIDMAGLAAALESSTQDVFVATMTGVFKDLADRVASIVDAIAGERDAVRQATQQIQNPSAMTPEAILRQITGINTALPGNAAMVQTGQRLNYAETVAAQARAQRDSALATYNPALEAYRAAQAQVPSLQAQYDQLAGVIAGKEAEIAQPRKYSEGRQYVRELQATMPGLYAELNQIGAALAAAKAASSDARWAEITVMADRYAAAVASNASAQAAAEAAAKAARDAVTSYVDSMQDFALNAAKSVDKLADLRAETLRYYEAQKALSQLMKSSAEGLRKAAYDYRFGQMDPEAQFRELRTKFDTAYSMALSTDGETLASYADELRDLLNPLLDRAADVYGSDQALNSFIATMLARIDNIAGRVDTLAPIGYEAESLAVLNQIDATLAALSESAGSAERILVDAINTGRDATVHGLRQVVNALSGQPIAAFATGGYHLGGLRIVGENGPELEATGPARIFSAAQTRQILAGGNANNELLLEIRRLREEVSDLRAEARATASNTAKTARQLDRIEMDGMLVRTDADTPLHTETSA